jgi:hypothetical protein
MRERQLRQGFLRHRGLIAFAAGGAAVETAVLTFVAPGARPLAPQATSLPPIAAYHDLRWLFAGNQPVLTFALGCLLLLAMRAGIDTLLLRLAWPADRAAPPLPTIFLSYAGLTTVAWVLLAPAVTLAFGVAVLPFSWPFLAALPILIGITAALSHGGATPAWWHRLPSAATVTWLLVSFVTMSLASALMVHIAALAAVAVASAAGVVNARAWYALAGTTTQIPEQVGAHAHGWRSAGRLLWWIPTAPLVAVLIVAGGVGLARLVFTGTIRLPVQASMDVGAIAATGTHMKGAVVVAAGFGSSCCDDTGHLDQSDPGMVVEQFSYLGMDGEGRPLTQGPSADDLPLSVLGDRLAAQVLRLHARTGQPVSVVAESEGTLGVYAMLARHRRLPLASIVLLSPIVSPGEFGAPGVPRDALTELNRLIGRMSPYGSAGAQQLIGSVAGSGANYFTSVTRIRGIRWLAVVPLADATTLPACSLPSGVLVVPAFHGGLLGDPMVQRTVGEFLAGQQVETGSAGMRAAAEAITGVTAAWRMPVSRLACP